MSDEDINMRLKWRFSYFDRDEKAFFVYSNSFDTSLIADVKIEIFSGVLNLKEYFVVLSKTPYTPANATITIQSRGYDKVEHVIYQKHVNRWMDNYSFKCKFHKDSLFTDELDSVILSELQCDITWHGYDESERDIIYGSLEQFITAPDFSDMVIVIGEKEIPVHKIILAAYSPVFLAMFKANMTASVNKRIIVTDIEVDIMKKVIDFMYTGVIHPVPDIDVLISILEVADKYEIMTLEKLCEQKLLEKVRIGNVLEILDRTSLFRVPQLRQTITSFLVKNKSSIIGLEGFADLHNRKPELLFEFIINGIAPH
ncbi:hypothetical protein PV328_010455 [Microctonus aethiopoides]|uniref:BTB domain-containing protein n=1 Tax=Microctonus aethiopoides TaxID=144406 RepID=A0AA39FHS3_9HYME|nr:hypothetical protein PV328_010455 [Microctonus aethiopoides]